VLSYGELAERSGCAAFSCNRCCAKLKRSPGTGMWSGRVTVCLLGGPAAAL
jgi:hypothetical protein